MSSEYLAPTILSARRLFGPNLFSARAGAVLDVVCDDARGRHAVECWPAHAMRLAAALEWEGVSTVVQVQHKSASLFLTAPVDGLLAASDLTEHAWVASEAEAAGSDALTVGIDAEPLLRAAWNAERHQRRGAAAMREFAEHHTLAYSLDDDGCSVGVGRGAYVLQHADVAADEAAPSPSSWEQATDRPTALITGSNGKTTTTRLVAAIARAAGLSTGWSCSDGVWIDGVQVESGDYTGPGGARRVLCDPAVDCAVLETARGGMLRRGLAINRVDAAVITNISADHFGEYGVESLHDLARAKAIVARALRASRPLALNADDPTLQWLAADAAVPVAWFTLSSGNALIEESIRATGLAVCVRNDHLMTHVDGTWRDVGAVVDLPITLRGSARHNIANAAAAVLVASVMRLPVAAMRQALATFGAHAEDNPGRLMVRTVGGVTLVMDYAHNPDGMAALCRTAAAIPASRRLLLFGQAGNRDDAQLRALAGAAWETQRFDRVIIKEMVDMLRGRAPGEITGILREALIEAGAPADRITVVDSELAGVREALSWSRPGDVLVLGVHVSRAQVLALVDALIAGSWRAGEPITSP